MKIYLPIVSLVVLIFVTSVHSRAIHRFRRSVYYANETGKDGELGEPLPQEAAKDVPVSTTFIPVSISSDVKEENSEDASHVKKDEDTKEVSLTEASQSHDTDSKDVTTPEEVTTAKQPDKIPDSESKKDQQQDKPEERQQADDEHQKPDKESESITSAAVTDPPLQEKATASVEDIPQATKEPESSTKPESDDSDKKLEEAVTETKKEGRSGTDELQSETTSSASVEDTSKLSEEPDKLVEDKLVQEEKEPSDKNEPAIHKSESTLASSSEEKQEPASEIPEVEKDSTTVAPVEQKSSDENLPLPSLKDKEEPIKHAPSTEASVEDSKNEEGSVIVVYTTPQADKQEGRQGIADASDEKTELKKDEDSFSEENTQKEDKEKELDTPSKSNTSPELPLKEEQKDEIKTTTTSSDAPVEETKEAEKEVTPPAKSGPSKRFADWIDYVPHDFRV